MTLLENVFLDKSAWNSISRFQNLSHFSSEIETRKELLKARPSKNQALRNPYLGEYRPWENPAAIDILRFRAATEEQASFFRVI